MFESPWRSAAVTLPLRSTSSVRIFSAVVCILMGICLRLRMMSVTSSTTPGSEENSCRTPSILTAVIAAPSIDDRSTRRSALPMVVPKPRSNGWA